MDFVDIIFPLNLGPLTYRCPDHLRHMIGPGMLVSAPLKKRMTKGIAIGAHTGSPPGRTREIHEVHGNSPVLTLNMIHLLEWMSGYYLAEQGLVLKNMLPKEVFAKVRKRETPSRLNPAAEGKGVETLPPAPPIGNEIIAGLRNSFSRGTYRTFLLHAPSTLYEYALLMEILSGIRRAIILVPELSDLEKLTQFLRGKLGDRICVFHGELNRGQKAAVIEKVLSGRVDILVGTRTALFIPLKNVSFIAVLNEHSSAYKQEKSPCYNARDVAVMKGFLEKTTVLLSSISPSVESLYNGKTGKYTLLTPQDTGKRPGISIIDMRYAKLVRPYLSKAVIDASAKHIRNDGKIMFVINRRGYSSLLQCADCNTIVGCPDCRIPLVFHKEDQSLKCHYCGLVRKQVPDRCTACRGYKLHLLGAGTQRVQEDIEKLTGMKTLRLDSDKVKKKSELQGIIASLHGKEGRILIGTKLIPKRIGFAGTFSMAALLNTDTLLSIPDFRSAEKAFQEIMSVIDKIGPDGRVFIQTRMPENYLFKSLRSYDHHVFFKEELTMRRDLFYPPFSRLILLRVVTNNTLGDKLSDFIAARTTKEEAVEILGPRFLKNRQGKTEYRLLLKSGIREKLHAAAKSFIEAFKDSREVRVKVDVDPLEI